MRTKIYVMTHKKFRAPKDPAYVPLQVGRALQEDLGYTGDHTGDSISEKNPYYGELTGIYWVWKNVKDADLVGVCHYRRYFIGPDGKPLRKEQYEEMLAHADVLVSDPVMAPTRYLDYFGEAHPLRNMLLAGETIRRLFPDDYRAFEQVMNGRKYYFGNLCVMRRELFDAYCAWLFGIFFEMEKSVDVSGCDEYHKRVFGFLSEELLLVYITARQLRVKEGHVGITAEKAETAECKLAMAQLVRMGQFSEARELLCGYLKLRPDVQLELSDIKHEIPDIELILFILEKEAQQGEEGFYALSHELKDLIGHLRRLKEIYTLREQGTELDEQQENYLKEHPVTAIADTVILENL